MFRYFLWVLMFLTASGTVAAQAESRCQTKAATKKTQFHAEMDQIETTYRAARQEIIDNGILMYADGDMRDSVLKAVEQLVSEARLDEKRRVWSASADEFVAATIEKGKASGNCRRFGFLRDAVVRATTEYELHHEGLNVSIERRLAVLDLAADEGLAIMVVASSGYAERVLFSRRGKQNDDFEIGPLANENYFQVVKLKAGKYWWNKVKTTGGNRKYMYFKLNGLDKVDLKVEAGKVNYIGVFSFQRRGATGATALVVDRVAEVMRLFEQRYPELVGKHPLANGLTGDDSVLSLSALEER